MAMAGAGMDDKRGIQVHNDEVADPVVNDREEQGGDASAAQVGSPAGGVSGTRAYDALLLDFGSVVTFTAFERHRESERLLGLTPGTLDWLGPVDPATDVLWQRMQRDEISEREYWDARAAEVGAMVGQPSWKPLDFFQAIRGEDPDLAVRASAWQTVRAARAAGLKVGILSNELELYWGRSFMDRLGLLHDIDVLVDATHTRILKPDPRAYQLALDALGLTAQRVLFVDDQLRNVDGARQVGMSAVHFDVAHPERCFARVRTLLGVE